MALTALNTWLSAHVASDTHDKSNLYTPSSAMKNPLNQRRRTPLPVFDRFEIDLATRNQLLMKYVPRYNYLRVYLDITHKNLSTSTDDSCT